MAYFLNREDHAARPPRGIRCAYVSGAESSTEDHGNPSSPLSRFVNEGYGGRPPLPNQGGFDAGVAQQWSSNVQSGVAAHQQEHDPNFVQVKPKTHGFRVSQAAGGQSSLSLAWDGTAGAMEPSRRGRGAGMQQPTTQPQGGAAFSGQGGGNFVHQTSAAPAHRDPSPGFAAGSRASSRPRQTDSGMAGCLGDAAYGDAAYRRPQDQQHGGGSRAPSPGIVAGSRASSRQSEAGMAGCLGGAAYGDAAYGRPQDQQYGGGRGNRAPSPGFVAGSRGSSRQSDGGMAGCMGGGAYGEAASRPPLDPRHGNFALPPPPPPAVGMNMGGGRQLEAMSLPFGNRVEHCSSNAYARGENQNCGNGITDRRTTKVMQPPGGGSQISFG